MGYSQRSQCISPLSNQSEKQWLDSSKYNMSKSGLFKSHGWLATCFYGGIQATI